jgi:hypothetical protein
MEPGDDSAGGKADGRPDTEERRLTNDGRTRLMRETEKEQKISDHNRTSSCPSRDRIIFRSVRFVIQSLQYCID